LKATRRNPLNRDEKSVLRVKLAFPSGIPFRRVNEQCAHYEVSHLGLFVTSIGSYNGHRADDLSIGATASEWRIHGRAGTVAAFNEYGPEKVRTYGWMASLVNNRLASTQPFF